MTNCQEQDPNSQLKVLCGFREIQTKEEYKLSDPINKASYCLCLMSKNYETSTGETAVRCSEILLLTSVGKVNANHESEYHHCAYNNENHMTQSVLQGDLNLMKDLKGSGQSPEVHWHKPAIIKSCIWPVKGAHTHIPQPVQLLSQQLLKQCQRHLLSWVNLKQISRMSLRALFQHNNWSKNKNSPIIC